jgi:hypothetical protein
MKTYHDLIRRPVAILVLALFTIAAVGACKSGPLGTLTQANLDKIQTGMSSAEVKSILGDPTDSQSETIPIVGGTKTTYNYSTNDAHIVIVLKNDTVQTKEGTFSPAPQ